MTKWIQTYTGKKIDPFYPDPKQIEILDIAHALSQTCRFSGHTDLFYSVAEHCFNLSYLVKSEFAIYGLLHDAAEAYLNDVVRPVKPFARFHYDGLILTYKEVEDALLNTIITKFIGECNFNEQIYEYDDRLTFTEGTILMPDTTCWELQKNPFKIYLNCWSPLVAERHYLQRFAELIPNMLQVKSIPEKID